MPFDINPVITSLIIFGLKSIVALIIFIIGRWLAGWLSRYVRRYLTKGGADEAVARIASTLTYITVLLLAVVVALAALGVQTTVFAGLIAAFGLAIGLALQGALSNFAGGVLILTFRPYRIGDLVEISGETGVVEDIQIVSTILATADATTVIIPNGQVANGVITNYSTTGVRRVDMVFGAGYETDIQKAQSILTQIISQHPHVLPEPEPTVRVLALAESSVNFAVRPFAKLEHYWDVYFDVTEQVKTRFDAEGISIPFPKHDVRVIQAGSSG